MPIDNPTLARAADVARGLALDAVHACSSGHLGLPLGAAEIGAVLFGEALRYDPTAPRWLNRDRFILSAGHGSMFLYSWLHLAGYDLPLDQVKAFRQLHSQTPGHPEFNETPGVEATTGPLGQGVGNAVGYAISNLMLAERFNRPGHELFDARVVCLAGDGCMQEGVAMEAVALAGHLKLANLTLIYDANDVTLDAPAESTQSEDTTQRFAALGWDVQTIDGNDIEAFRSAYAQAGASASGRPQLIIAKTLIGKGIAEVEGTWKAHGEGGAKFAEAARQGLGLPQETFYVDPTVAEAFAARKAELKAIREAWDTRYAEWAQAFPEEAALLTKGPTGGLSAETLLEQIPPAEAGQKVATRAAAGAAAQHVAATLPMFLSGSADLHGSTKNYLKELGDFSATNRAGRNFLFGIREHAMGAIVNGLAYDGVFLPSGATFLVFSDYLRPSLRLAGLASLRLFHFFTHDSVGVGEDGPTHQPVESTSSLRLIPNLDVLRPADAEETAAALAAAATRTDGPSILILTRQGVPALDSIPLSGRRQGTLKGAYVARAESGPLTSILMASGSELHLALEAAEEAGPGVRVVSMPSMERFLRQDANYRESVLPRSCRARVAVEAGVTPLWAQFVGLEGKIVGIDRFGLSAPGATVMKELGITVENVLATLREVMG